MTQHKNTRTCRLGALALLLVLLFGVAVFADPTGVTINSNTTVSGPVIAPAFMNTTRGTITTMILSAMQQDQHWKAYVGNVTGGFTLDNPAQATIYSWTTTTVTGQVYASRYNNITWSSGNIVCASQSLIGTESTFHNMTATGADRINATFNWTIHKQIQVGSNTIAQNTCNSTVMYINDTKQNPTVTSPFQEMLLMDSANSYMVYATTIDDNVYGYDNTTYDFQMIVAESDIKATPTPYYFYVELR